jgi:hypothetical protein
MSRGQTELDRRVLAGLLLAKRNLDRRQRQIRQAIVLAYETRSGDPRFCVRRREVVEHVARVLGIAVLNNRLFVEVEAAAGSLGFQAVKNGNRSIYRCAKRRDLDEEAALMLSHASRRDSRLGRPGMGYISEVFTSGRPGSPLRAGPS